MDDKGTIDEAGFRADLAALAQNDYPQLQLVKLPFNWYSPQTNGIIQHLQDLAHMGTGAFPEEVQNGSCIVVFGQTNFNLPGAVYSVTDTQGNVYTQVTVAGGFQEVLPCFICIGAKGGSTTVTIFANGGASQMDGIEIIEIAGVTSLIAFDQTGNGSPVTASGPQGSLAIACANLDLRGFDVVDSPGWQALDPTPSNPGQQQLHTVYQPVLVANPRLIQSTSQTFAANTVFPLAFTADVSVGDVIAVCASLAVMSASSFTFTDTQGNTYNDQNDNLGALGNQAIWTTTATASGPLTVTVTAADAGVCIVAIHELADVSETQMDYGLSVSGPPANPTTPSPLASTGKGFVIAVGATDVAADFTEHAGGAGPLQGFEGQSNAAWSMGTLGGVTDVVGNVNFGIDSSNLGGSLFSTLSILLAVPDFTPSQNATGWPGFANPPGQVLLILSQDGGQASTPPVVTSIPLNGPMNIFALVSEAIDEQGDYCASALIGQQSAAGFIRLNGQGNVWIPMSFADPLTPGYVTTEDNFAFTPIAGTGFSELEAPFHQLDWRPASPVYYVGNPPTTPPGFLLAFVGMNIGVGAREDGGVGDASTYAIPSAAGPITRLKKACLL